MILGGKLPGKVGRCRFFYTVPERDGMKKEVQKTLKKVKKALDYVPETW